MSRPFPTTTAIELNTAFRMPVPWLTGWLARQASLLRRALVLGCLLGFLSTNSWAGAFTVNPVRIFLTPQDRATALTIVNEGDAPLVLQTEMYRWAQSANGQEELTPSDDVVVSPPIIQLAPKARQVVRLARVAPGAAPTQLTFRVIVREVPDAAAVAATDQPPLALAVSLPIFITPRGAKSALACELKRGDAAATVMLCENSGTAYAQIRQVSLLRGTQEVFQTDTGVYVLPGTKRTIGLPMTERLAAGPYSLRLTTDDSQRLEFSATLP